MKRYIFLLLCILLLGAGISVSAQPAVPETVRVGIYFGSTAQSSVTISAPGGVYLQCDGTDLGWVAQATISQTDKNWSIAGGAEPVVFYGEKMTVIPSDGMLKLKDKEYRGNIELVPKDNQMTVVNHLNVEEYLYGVVPLEMSTGWPMEALKVQAICARTFVVRNMGKYISQGFDVYNTTMSQVYGGASVEKQDTTRAVDETRGMVITYNGSIIDAVYFSTSSNFHTFNVEDVWGNPFPYLVGVDDSYQRDVRPDCNAWTKNFTREELQAVADRQNMNIGKLIDISIDGYSAEGAVKALTFTGTNGSYTAKNTATRNLLTLRSQGYSLSKKYAAGGALLSVLGADQNAEQTAPQVLGADGMLGEAKALLTANGVQPINTSAELASVTLNGTGYGHGVGMSQYGAMGMAKAGFTYDQIIKHYYTGVEITQ